MTTTTITTTTASIQQQQQLGTISCNSHTRNMEAIPVDKEDLHLDPKSQKATTVSEEVLQARTDMAKAIQIAASKVKLHPKAESGYEMYTRINSEKEKKKNKAVKCAAKKMIKKKEIKKMTYYFMKK
jgi:hypothetical protein